jgi:hypothetical protein
MLLTGTVLSPQGKPVPMATVEVIAYDDRDWRRGLRDNEVDHYQTQADAAGKFRLVVPRDISRPRDYTHLIAGAEGFAPAMQSIESTLRRKHVEIKLHEPKVVRLQLIDAAGNPLARVQPQLWSANGKDEWLSAHHGHPYRTVSAWPRFSKSDTQGNVTLTVPAFAEMLEVSIDDERLGDHVLRVQLSDAATGVVVEPAQALHGKITAEDTGEPLAGALVVMMKEPYRKVRTAADGSFRLLSGATTDSPYPGGRNRYMVHIYPPPESLYLAGAGEWQKPKDGFGDGELSVALKRGIVVQGRVIEKQSQKPVAGASVHFVPQSANNPFFRDVGATRSATSDLKSATDGDGRFRLAVWPGPGYLLVRGPTIDFVHVEITEGDLQYGKPGLNREYHHGALRINLEPDKPPSPLTFELERGVTLRRRVVRPDGKPAAGKAYARSYLLHNDEIHSWLPPIPLEAGVLEMPGFAPERSKPIFIFDPQGGCAAVVAPTAAEVDLASPPIQLQPCGAARFRFVTDKGTVLSDYEPMLRMNVTPGSSGRAFIRPEQPLWSENIIWQNVARPAKIPKTDSEGRVTVTDLIPGATYRVLYVGKEDWTDGYEFTVRSGETVEVGEVVIPERDE